MIELPHSTESERAVLAAIQIDPEAILPQVSTRLDPRDFYAERHGLIYRAALDISAEGATPDMRTVQARLEELGNLEQVGGLAYLAGLDVDLPDMARIDAYVAIVKECSLRRRLYLTAQRIAAQAVDGGVETQDALDLADAAVLELYRELGRGLDRGKPLVPEMQRMAERLQQGKRPTAEGILTGFPFVDQSTSGLRPGKFWLIAARPGKGKSAVALQIVLRAATHGARTLVFSAEMDVESLALRGLAHISGIDLDRISRGRVQALGQQMLGMQLQRLERAQIDVFDDCPTVETIALRSKVHAQERGLDLIVVDYLQLLDSADKRADTTRQVAHISRSLKSLAKTLRVPVLALSQLRRMQGGDWARPSLADLKDTSQLEQDADVVLFPWASEEHSTSEQDFGEIILAKNRDGSKGVVPVVFEKPIQTFRLVDDRR